MSRVELRSRREIYFANYRKIKSIEAKTMLEMTMRDYIPAVSKYIGKLSDNVKNLTAVIPGAKCLQESKHIEKLASLLEKTYASYAKLEKLQERAASIVSTEEAAFFYCKDVSDAMKALRANVDSLEVITAREAWPVPTYGDMTYGGIL